MPATTPIILAHLAGAVTALVLGAAQLASPKGTPSHRARGYAWVTLMLGVSLSSFWIMEIREGAGWSLIHLLSVWTLISLGVALWAIRRGNVRLHRGFMVGTFLGLIGAGLGAFAPDRLLNHWFLG